MIADTDPRPRRPPAYRNSVCRERNTMESSSLQWMQGIPRRRFALFLQFASGFVSVNLQPPECGPGRS